ncbi:MAG: hypothetical protein IIC76_11080 [Bacteroidetes bacterium]|nr:hypothetical protein [Bacteroidota bacterium]
MNLTIDDRRWLKRNYRKLNFKFEKDSEIIEGPFEFKASFDRITKLYFVNPTVNNRVDLNYIEDAYEIRIIIPTKQSDFPIVQEIAQRIKNLAKKLGKQSIDLHIYENGIVCATGPFDEPRNFSLVNFINGPVLQFFYDQSYYERFDQWPRDTYSHGYLGLIENYFDNFKMDRKGLEKKCIKKLIESDDWKIIKKYLESDGDIKGYWLCICGSNLNFRTCHPKVFEGLLQLRNYYKVRGRGLITLLVAG